MNPIHENIKQGKYKNKLPFSTNRKDPEGFRAYRAEENRLIDLFRADLETEYGMKGHPKADKLWNKACLSGCLP